MLLAKFTRTGPHPSLEVEPIALGPFLAASLAIGAAAYVLAACGVPYAMAIAFLYALTALISYGPQKYVDAAISKFWPPEVVAQFAITAPMCLAICQAFRLMRPKNKATLS